MFCTNCGSEVEDSAVFCTSCGASLEPAADDKAEPAAAPEQSAAQDGAQEASEPGLSGQAGATTVLTDLGQAGGAAPAPAGDGALACPQCGTALLPDAKFCTTCGTTIGQAAPPVEAVPVQTATMPQATAPTAMATPVPMAQAQASQPVNFQANNQPSNDSRKKTGIIVGAIAAVAVIAIAFIVFLVVLPGNGGDDAGSNTSSTSASPTQEQTVRASFTGSKYAASSATPVVVTVEGYRSSDGSSYKETFYVDGEQSLTLPYGHYDATPKASPLTDDGTLFTISPASVSFDVSNSGASTPLSWTLTAIDASAVTDEQINAAVSAANEAGVSDTDAAAKRDKAKAAREAAQKAAAEAQAQAEAQAKAQAEAEAQAKAQAEVQNAPTWYVCASDFVTLRTSASTGASEITKITSRQPVKYLGAVDSSWSKVSYNGSTGYVLTRFISSNRNAPLDYGDV